MSSSVFVAGRMWLRSFGLVRLNAKMLSVCLIITSSMLVGVFVM